MLNVFIKQAKQCHQKQTWKILFKNLPYAVLFISGVTQVQTTYSLCNLVKLKPCFYFWDNFFCRSVL